MKMQRWFSGLILAAWALVSASALGQGSVGTNNLVYAYLQGQRTGEILGEVTTAGREGLHAVLAYSHEVVVPYDAATGKATGRRQHQPFRIVKLINRGSPLLLQALANNETLTTVRIDLWTMGLAGKYVHVATYELANARIVSLRPWMPNKSDAATAGYTPAEEVAFTYESITVTFVDGGITATDEWADSGT